MIIIPEIAMCSAKANIHSIFVDHQDGTGQMYFFPGAASAGTESSSVVFGINTPQNLCTFPALQANTPYWGGKTGEVGAAYLDAHRLEVDGFMSVMGIGEASEALPSLSMFGDVATGAVGSGSAELPVMDLSADNISGTFQGNILLRLLELEGVGVRGVLLEGDLHIRAPSIEGWFDSRGEGSQDTALAPMSVTGTIIASNPATVALTFPAIISAGSISYGPAGSAAIVLPALAVAVSGAGVNALGTGALQFPLLEFDASLASDLPFLGVYVSAMNPKLGAVSDYEQWPFNSYCMAGGYGYGAKDDGIYELIGSRDDRLDIFAEIRKISIDLESFEHKRLTDAYFHLHSNGPYQIVIYADQVSSEHNVNDPGGGIHAWKVGLPRGIKGQGIGVGVKATNVDFILDEVAMVSEFTSRRNR